MSERLNEAALIETIRAYAADFHGSAWTTDAIALDAELIDLGFDSIDVVLLSGQLEETFGIELDPAFFLRQTTIGAMLDELRRMGHAD